MNVNREGGRLGLLLAVVAALLFLPSRQPAAAQPVTTMTQGLQAVVPIGFVVDGQQPEVHVGPEHPLMAPQGPRKTYATSGRDPRGRRVTGWSVALNYLQSAAAHHDVENRLKRAVRPEYQQWYSDVVVKKYFEVIQLAVKHGYMCGDGTCHVPECQGDCKVQRWLRSVFKECPIPRGTIARGITEGPGTVGVPDLVMNIIHRAKGGDFRAYRVFLNDLPVGEEREVAPGRKVRTVAHTCIDLIVECRNMELGEIYAREVETFLPPEVCIPPTKHEVEEVQKLVAKANAKAEQEQTQEQDQEARAEANAKAQGGNSVVNNNNTIIFPQAQMACLVPNQIVRTNVGGVGGALTFTPVTSVNNRNVNVNKNNNANNNNNTNLINNQVSATATAISQSLAEAPVSVGVNAGGGN